MRAPQVEAATTLPPRVTVYEVGARDGLQNEPAVVPAPVKAEFIRRLVAAGLPIVETTSFVNPQWVPQLADAAEVLAALGPDGLGRSRPVLVPNMRGFDRAAQAGVSAIAIFGSATESFAQRNLGRSIAESLAMFAPVVDAAKAAGMWVRAYVSMCFGDPWEGEVAVSQVVDVAVRLMDLGCDQLSIGDTIGVATTGHVHRLLAALDRAGIGVDRVGVHFHDTYGQALANTLAALGDGRDRGRLVGWRAGRLPVRQERHGQPRDRGPGLGACTGPESRPASTCRRSLRPARGWPSALAARPPHGWSPPSSTADPGLTGRPVDRARPAALLAPSSKGPMMLLSGPVDSIC